MRSARPIKSSAARESACTVTSARAASMRCVSDSTASRGGSPDSSTGTADTSMGSPMYITAALRKVCFDV